jgi:hypothetical protein
MTRTHFLLRSALIILLCPSSGYSQLPLRGPLDGLDLNKLAIVVIAPFGMDPAPLQVEALTFMTEAGLPVGNPDPRIAAAVLELNYKNISRERHCETETSLLLWEKVTTARGLVIPASLMGKDWGN